MWATVWCRRCSKPLSEGDSDGVYSSARTRRALQPYDVEVLVLMPKTQTPQAQIVVVTLDESCLDAIDQKAAELASAGLNVTDVLEAIGQVTGEWSGPDFAPLRAVQGVVAVETSREISLPPPDSGVQ